MTCHSGLLKLYAFVNFSKPPLRSTDWQKQKRPKTGTRCSFGNSPGLCAPAEPGGCSGEVLFGHQRAWHRNLLGTSGAHGVETSQQGDYMVMVDDALVLWQTDDARCPRSCFFLSVYSEVLATTCSMSPTHTHRTLRTRGHQGTLGKGHSVQVAGAWTPVGFVLRRVLALRYAFRRLGGFCRAFRQDDQSGLQRWVLRKGAGRDWPVSLATPDVKRHTDHVKRRSSNPSMLSR